MLRAWWYLWGVVWTYADGYKLKLVYANLSTVAYAVLGSLKPAVFGLFINSLQTEGTESLRKPIFWLAVFAGIHALYKVIQVPARRFEQMASFSVAEKIHTAVYDLLTRLPFAWHKKHPSGDTINRLQKASGAIDSFVDNNFEYVDSIVRIIASLIGITIIEGVFGFTTLLAFIFVAMVMWVADAALIRATNVLNEREHDFAAVRHGYISNILTVITLRMRSYATSFLRETFNKQIPPLSKTVWINEIKWAWQEVSFGLLKAGVLLAFILQMDRTGDVILVGSVTALYGYLDKLGSIFIRLAVYNSQILTYKVHWNALQSILDAEGEISDENSVQVGDWNSITIRNVEFSYEDKDELSLDLQNANIQLEHGKKIAFIGKSGSGKTTLLKVLRGLELASSCDIVIDESVHIQSSILSAEATLVQQDVELFDDTIRFNVALGAEMTDEEVRAYTDMSCFTPVYEKLPSGLDTRVFEKGVNFSGGEQQRLSIARGLAAAKMAGSSLLLMDEPTSNLDPKNAEMVLQNIFKAFEQECVVSTVHDMSLLPLFDYIYVFGEGKCIDRGTYQELHDKGVLEQHVESLSQ